LGLPFGKYISSNRCIIYGTDLFKQRSLKMSFCNSGGSHEANTPNYSELKPVHEIYNKKERKLTGMFEK